MKKLFYLLSVVVLNTLPVGAQTNYFNQFPYLFYFYPYCFYDWKQDVNKDKVVDTQDVLQIYEYVAANDGATVNDVVDVNGDGTVDTQDVLAVYENIQDPYLVSLVNRGPAIEVMKNAINMMDYYYVLLHDAVLQLSIFLPTDDNLLTYVEPLSLARSIRTGQPYHIWKFSVDPSRPYNSRVTAKVYEAGADAGDGSSEPKVLQEVSGNIVNSRLEDVLRNGLVNEWIRPDKHYYRTLANTFIRVDTDAAGNMTVSGGLQNEQGAPVKVVQTTDVVNGTVYITDAHAYTTARTVYDILDSKDYFSEFLELVIYSDMLSTIMNLGTNQHAFRNVQNFSYSEGRRLMGNYHYTLYAPTNVAMSAARDHGLPTTSEFDAAEEAGNTERMEQIVSIWRDFIRYHVQENAVFIDGEVVDATFPSAKTNPQTGRPYNMHVEADAKGITVTDGIGQRVPVSTTKDYNQMAREYWGNYNANMSYTVSLEPTITTTIVVQPIETPLQFSASQFTYSPDNEYTGIKAQ